MHKYLLILTLSCISFGYSQENQAKEIKSDHFKRLFKVSESIYRSDQPSKKGFTEIEEIGIKTVLNLRRIGNDTKKARHTNLVLKQIKLKSKTIEQNDIIEVLKVIKDAEKPVLIHCWHGSDRTGILVASYRIIFENWTKEQTIEEMRKPAFGYHEKWHPYLLDKINGLDVQKIRTEVGL